MRVPHFAVFEGWERETRQTNRRPTQTASSEPALSPFPPKDLKQTATDNESGSERKAPVLAAV